MATTTNYKSQSYFNLALKLMGVTEKVGPDSSRWISFFSGCKKHIVSIASNTRCTTLMLLRTLKSVPYSFVYTINLSKRVLRRSREYKELFILILQKTSNNN